MPDISSSRRKYLLAVALGAVGGSILVAAATRAMPKMMARMMQNMMAQMGGEGCNPAEM
ncbi:MAG: hypothetical protein ACE5KP_07380 [Dehalococcoidales bacterium]